MDEKENPNFEPQMNFWDYCKAICEDGRIQRQWAIADLEAIARSFDCQWSVEDCVETILERRASLRL